MPKNKKRGKNNKNKRNVETKKRELVFKAHSEEYAVVEKKLGDRRMMLMLPSGREVMGIIPGRFRKRCWFDIGDLTLISFREFQDNKADVIYKYNQDERMSLQHLGEIAGSFGNGVMAGDDSDNDDGEFAFDFEAI
jgi:translation initiation factor 1A